MKKKPEFYFTWNRTINLFDFNHYNYGIYIGRVKEMGNDLVWNVYLPFCSFGYGW